MKEQFWTLAVALAIAAASPGCAPQGQNGRSGEADRSAQRGNQDSNGGHIGATTGNESKTPEPSGSTTGAASGSLENHDRGGGSTGSADRSGSTATKPSRESPPNVDPSVANRRTNVQTNSPAGQSPNPSTDFPDQRRKQ